MAGQPAAGSLATGVVGGALARPLGERTGADGLSTRQRRLNRAAERTQERSTDEAEERTDEDSTRSSSRVERPRRVLRRD